MLLLLLSFLITLTILRGLTFGPLSEAIVVARTEDREPMRLFMKERFTGSIKVDFHWLEERCGTADALREIKDKIKVRRTREDYRIGLDWIG